jgi:hypothetical protein
MSSLETTGKVLWSLSVVIAALEHYEKVIHTCTTKHYRRHKSDLRSLRLQLGTERDIFINMLEQLLEGLVKIEHMTEFLSDPGGEAWQNATVDMELKYRLRHEYEIYLGNVDGMRRSLEMIREKLALGPDGKVCKSVNALFSRHTTDIFPAPILRPKPLQARIQETEVQYKQVCILKTAQRIGRSQSIVDRTRQASSGS